MSVDANLSAAFAFIRDKLNTISPRLLPGGGTTGQALVKTGSADNSVAWADLPAGGGSDFLASDNAWTGSNAFNGPVALGSGATATTAARGTSNTGVATNAYVISTNSDLGQFVALSLGTKVDKNNAVLTGYATAPTADPGNADEQIANCEFVANEIGALAPRLVPNGGTTGQTITRDGSGALTWANPSGGSSYTLATDTAPALGAALDLKGFDLKSILPANSIQNLKAIPQASGGVAALGIAARKNDDSATLASVQVGTLTATTGEVVLSGSRITVATNSNGTSTARYVLPSTTGVAGQVLTSSGSTTSAATWTTPTPPHPGYRSGAWYGTNCVTPLADNTLAKNMLYATPVFIGSAASMNGLGVFTGYSASGSFVPGSAYLGIYNMSGSSTAYPGSLVRTGSVSLSGSSTACTATVSSYSLAPGWYWMVLLMNTTTYITGPDYNDRSNASIIGMTGPSLNSSPNGLAVAYTYAALPNGFPTGATPTQACPTLYWKAT